MLVWHCGKPVFPHIIWTRFRTSIPHSRSSYCFHFCASRVVESTIVALPMNQTFWTIWYWCRRLCWLSLYCRSNKMYIVFFSYLTWCYLYLSYTVFFLICFYWFNSHQCFNSPLPHYCLTLPQPTSSYHKMWSWSYTSGKFYRGKLQNISASYGICLLLDWRGYRFWGHLWFGYSGLVCKDTDSAESRSISGMRWNVS